MQAFRTGEGRSCSLALGIGHGSNGGDMSPEPSWITRATCIRVIDGDTIEVELRRVIRVRMLDCWAPESRSDNRLPEDQRESQKKKGLDSKKNLQELCEGKTVIVQIPSSDEVGHLITLGRWLGHVWLDGDEESLSEKQVRGGFAEKNKPERLVL
jgi:endonuclease YncB( thermonuclease family)